MKNKRSQGFTLLEMSIVLLIIGTIVGAIMLGRTLLVTARMQTILSDADSYIASVVNFRQVYQSLPGDMAGATNVWGAVSNGCTSFAGGTGTKTCNGNGDGKIAPPGSEYESSLLWQHLFNAGMIASGTGNPTSSFKGGYFSFSFVGLITPTQAASGPGFLYPGTWNHVMSFAPYPAYWLPPGNNQDFYPGYGGGQTAAVYGASFTPQQVASMDTKVDDGFPGTGKVRNFNATSIPCTMYNASNSNCSTGTSLPGCYNISNPIVDCTMIWVTGF